MPKTKIFTGDQFVGSHGRPPQEKADFLNDLVRFAQGGFKKTLFTKSLYERLRNTFGHIAHYDLHGFYYEWFENAEKQAEWIDHVLNSPIYGQAEYTYCDAEMALQRWLRESGLLQQYKRQAENEIQERNLQAMIEIYPRLSEERQRRFRNAVL